MEWTRKQKAYQQTLADPEEERDREQLADFLGVSAETLCRWEAVSYTHLTLPTSDLV